MTSNVPIWQPFQSIHWALRVICSWACHSISQGLEHKETTARKHRWTVKHKGYSLHNATCIHVTVSTKLTSSYEYMAMVFWRTFQWPQRELISWQSGKKCLLRKEERGRSVFGSRTPEQFLWEGKKVVNQTANHLEIPSFKTPLQTQVTNTQSHLNAISPYMYTVQVWVILVGTLYAWPCEPRV